VAGTLGKDQVKLAERHPGKVSNLRQRHRRIEMVLHKLNHLRHQRVLVDVGFAEGRFMLRFWRWHLIHQQIFQHLLRAHQPAVLADQIGRQVNRRTARAGDDPAVFDVGFIDYRNGFRETQPELVAGGEVDRAVATVQ